MAKIEFLTREKCDIRATHPSAYPCVFLQLSPANRIYRTTHTYIDIDYRGVNGEDEARGNGDREGDFHSVAP